MEIVPHELTNHKVEPATFNLATSASVCTWMGDRISMSISADSPWDETLNRLILMFKS